MRKVLNFALIGALAISSTALYAQQAPAGAVDQYNTPAEPATAAEQADPTVSGDLAGVDGTTGLSTDAKVAVAAGVVAMVAIAAAGGSGGSSGTTGTN